MSHDFNERTLRRGTLSYKWDQGENLFGDPEVLPLWVADMDFKCAPAIVRAVNERAAQAIYGYTIRTEEYVQAITGWFRRRHHWDIDAAWLTDSPGVVPSLSIAVQSLTEPGDAVILQSPVYNPFYDVILKNGRKLAESPLLLKENRYEMDYDRLEELMKDGAKLLLLCSPQNPGGRVWTKEELVRLGDLCVKYDVKVVADEIHCDLVLPEHRHFPFASLSEAFAERTVTCLAPSKTFNIPGLQTSFTVISNRELKRKFDRMIEALGIGSVNFFGPSATMAAYNESEDWLDALLGYVKANQEFAVRYLDEHLPELTPVPSEGTYLLWVDCRKLSLSSAELKRLMYKEAKIAFNEGSLYGRNGEGFLRINLACPQDLLKEALDRFSSAVKNRGE
ncbi:pyridoxal phosphate-dependent aminotransferase [Paenibacillus sp. alder61]|uniref:cysteine-S-conjugate beta-lyase n=1 Tax=Paenibacillus faecis TaxID=862114 RepID=A0A5D0CXA0_9BACL|nr:MULTISPECIES: MalY/PatB family protein [Paenibacillus]MCA1291979.1 pyridoxal phosphate-dependent aminotransferase [Paenibacillus sp. alder61]TYA13557.1 pyridoxal phosphate-dependent aminotransferase [Paenibacillus faecis]